MKTGKESGLRVEIVDGELRICIGISVLAHSALHSPFVQENITYNQETGETDDTQFVVTDEDVFAVAIQTALEREEEDGSGPLSNLFDRATAEAIEDGCCEGVSIPSWDI